MVAKKETIIDTDKNNVSNVDSIPLQDQIIPNPLLKKIFGTTKRATEKIATYCNVLQTKKHKNDKNQPDSEQDPKRVNLDYQSLTDNETFDNESLDKYFKK